MINDIEHCAIIQMFENLWKSDSRRKRAEKKETEDNILLEKINQIINQFLEKEERSEIQSKCRSEI